MELEMSASSRQSLSSRLERSLATGLVLFLVGLPFHLVVKTSLPDPIGTYWKEILLGLLVVIWATLGFIQRRILIGGTALDLALLAYLGYLLMRLVFDRPGDQAWWGFYASVMYLPVFWLTAVVLRRYPTWLGKLAWLIVSLGAIVSLGGLVEFVIDRSLWPSAELVQRQGFPDVYVYGTHLRRVYFVFDSPTTLANTLALIFPMSLGLAYAATSAREKLLAGTAALLMLACIGFTFSRGIWVASALGLVIMGFLSGFFQRDKRLTLGLVGLVIVGLVVWGGVTLLRTSRLPGTDQGLVELTAEEYNNAPVLAVEHDLLERKPDFGETPQQVWTLYDPIAGQDDQRTVLYEPALKGVKTEVIYRVTVPDLGALKFGIALSPEVWSPEKGDGVNFQVYIAPVDAPQSGQFLFHRYINPKINPSDRRWRNFFLDLSPWAGREVNLSFINDSGPVENWDFDWAGWSEVSVVRLPYGYFTTRPASGDNLLLQYIRSIGDWARDETNRDRLAAWNLAVSAWLKSPLWGDGLGSTGLAGLRTNPEGAFVTESQVLKVLAELGIPGLILWLFVWFTIAKAGLQTLRLQLDFKNRAILFGILTSMLIIFIEGLVYQNMEVKQVNALTWTLAGMLAYLSTIRDG